MRNLFNSKNTNITSPFDRVKCDLNLQRIGIQTTKKPFSAQ